MNLNNNAMKNQAEYDNMIDSLYMWKRNYLGQGLNSTEALNSAHQKIKEIYGKALYKKYKFSTNMSFVIDES